MHPLGAVDGVSNFRSPREWDACATPDHPRVQHRRQGPWDQVACPIKGDNAGGPVPLPAAASRGPGWEGGQALPACPERARAASPHRQAGLTVGLDLVPGGMERLRASDAHPHKADSDTDQLRLQSRWPRGRRFAKLTRERCPSG